MERELDRSEHQRVANAIRAAERRTLGEIYCVLARSSGDYFYQAGFAVLCAMLLVDVAVSIVLDHFWITARLPIFALIEALAAFAALIVLWAFPAARIHLVPNAVRYRVAHDNALRQFLARNVHSTTERTGVMIFVSLAEHYATVIADEGIHAKVPETEWSDIVEALTTDARNGQLAEGYVRAIESAGALLATHFPPRAGQPNELEDHLAEI